MSGDELRELRQRCGELAARAYTADRWAYTEFLTLAEQQAAQTVANEPGRASCVLLGGYAQAERKLACFGSSRNCGEEAALPIACVAIRPQSDKFADDLTHRDFLGAAMNLGLRRSAIGDIVVKDNRAWLFCLESLAGYICDNLEQVKRTTVCCALCEPPADILNRPPEPKEVVVASLRLDALLAAVYHLSRSESQALISRELVAVDDRPLTNAGATLKPGQRVSVRGHGRFSFEGELKQTAKGRLLVLVEVY